VKGEKNISVHKFISTLVIKREWRTDQD